MKAKIILISATTILASCATPEIVDIPKPPSLGQYVDFQGESLLSDSECPDIRGIYSLVPEVIYNGKNETRSALGDRLKVFSIWPFHTAELTQAISLENGSANLMEVFLVSQPSSEELLVELKLINDASEAAYRFSAAEGDFECSAGILKFPLRTYYGGLEGATLNGQVRNWVARTDNAMLVIHSYGPFKLKKKPDEGVFDHEYLRFQRLDSLKLKK